MNIKELQKCFTIKRGYVRVIIYNFNKLGVIVMTDECIPDKGQTVAERKKIIAGYLQKKGFQVSEDSF